MLIIIFRDAQSGRRLNIRGCMLLIIYRAPCVISVCMSSLDSLSMGKYPATNNKNQPTQPLKIPYIIDIVKDLFPRSTFSVYHKLSWVDYMTP